MLESFILRWGYVAVGAGTFFEGELILVAGGALAHRGLLSLPLVMLAAFLGSVAGDQLWFHLGRRFGRRLVERSDRWRAHARLVDAWLARHGVLFVFGFRFLYGIRTVTPLVVGASAYSAPRFAALNVLGAASWAMAVGGGGWLLGASLERLLQRTARVEELAVAIVVLALLAWLISSTVRRRRRAAR